MASEGPKSPGTAGNDATVGTVDWLNPGNITASDNAYATVAGANTSHYLTATNFGFTLQTGTTDGIVAEIEQSKANGGIEVSVKLIKAGTITGNDKSTGATLPDADAYTTYGGAADKWGVTLTPADVNASTFGVGFATSGAGAPANRKVDHIRMTHYYTAVAATSRRAVMFFSILFAVIRFALPYAASESFIRFLMRTVIPSEKRSETCGLRVAADCSLAVVGYYPT